MKSLLLLLCLSSFAFAETKLLLIGGGSRPADAMKTFSELAGGEKADILVIPWASESLEGAQNIRSELLPFTKGTVEVISHRLSPQDVDRLHDRLNKVTGIFFTGGDQNRLMKFIKSYGLIQKFKNRFQDGVIFAGTSAGTAIMSNPMLTGKADQSVIDGTKVELAEGLGLLPSDIIVDQHFIVRSRFNRLAGVILSQKDIIGLGIDEGTSLLLIGRKAKIIGPTQVMMFKKSDSHKLEITLLQPNESITL